MTQAPYFIPGTDKEPQRVAVLNFTGGSITTKRGVLAAMFTDGNNLDSCAFLSVERSRVGHVRTDYIGATPKTVKPAEWTQRKYASQTKSLAAGGEPIKIRIDGEWWGARLSGRHEDFMAFLCDNLGSLSGAIAWKSQRGTYYGPVSPTTETP